MRVKMSQLNCHVTDIISFLLSSFASSSSRCINLHRLQIIYCFFNLLTPSDRHLFTFHYPPHPRYIIVARFKSDIILTTNPDTITNPPGKAKDQPHPESSTEEATTEPTMFPTDV
ncbi:hypothetical protein BRARA_A01070 [Brassica rapa]|uniref:Uncharacterized protein n=1 Tax=Brassica campestris TaxID=3711 RepID=A0A398AKF8_BRACM|nr:hypothetical protein BRARA_A01070 [Brassica rapa]